MINVWSVVEHVRVASGAAELAIFTALLYWFFTSSCVADMLEVVGERVGGWCGRDSGAGSLRHAVRAHRRPNHHQQDVYAKLDAEVSSRNSSLYRLKEQQTVPAPQPPVQPQVGLACARCAPVSRESWREPTAPGPEPVINVLELGRQKYANSGVVTRYLCDLAQCLNLTTYDYKDVVPSVVKDESFQRVIEETTQAELREGGEGGGEGEAATRYPEVRRRVEARALASLRAISSAMSNRVLKAVAWVCHVALRRVSRGGCGCGAGAAALRRARDAGLPLVLVPLHRSHLDYILVTLALYLNGLRPPLVVSGDNLRIPFFGWVLRGCGAFFIRRRGDGADSGGDPLYKAALRSYILHSLAEHNNLEFFIEGGRTRTGKPQLPKAGILSVIMEAYRDGTIDDALLVPVTLNYDRLVEGSFVREQLGMPKQMETFWSALRGIWRMLNTNHGSIRIDFNQPISLKELVTSFQKYNHLSAPLERPLTPPGGNNNLAAELDRQILYNHSHSSLYGDDVSTDHKMMVEAIGRHLVYDAAQATALMATNVVSYVLLAELRGGAPLRRLHAAVEARGAHLRAAGRRLGYAGDTPAVVQHALELLGRGLVAREGGRVRARAALPAALELGYYANTVVAHYAAPAILATALESILSEDEAGAGGATVQHSRLMADALQLCEILSKEFLLCAPCQRIEELLLAALDALLAAEVLHSVQSDSGLEEERWSRRFAQSLDDEEGERRDPARLLKYTVSSKPEALAERRRLLVTLRPLTEAYAATCRGVCAGAQRDVVRRVLDRQLEDFAQDRLRYGEAVSSDAITNCLRLLKQWGVIEMYTEQQVRKIRICEQYEDRQAMDEVCHNIYKFNMDSPLLKQ